MCRDRPLTFRLSDATVGFDFHLPLCKKAFYILPPGLQTRVLVIFSTEKKVQKALKISCECESGSGFFAMCFSFESLARANKFHYPIFG